MASERGIQEAVRDREEYPLLRGQGRYLDDLPVAGALHLALVRSPYACARLRRVAADAAASQPGVITVITGATLRKEVNPIRALLTADEDCEYRATDWHAIAPDRVRCVGEIVAAVVAEDRYRAEDAAARIEVDYEELPAVPDAAAALQPDAPRVHAELSDNVLFRVRRRPSHGREAFEAAAVRVRGTFRHPRVAGLPIENCGAVADYHPATDELTLWSSTQIPHVLRDGLCRCLGHPTSRVRVIAPHVGGGFGTKMQLYPEEVIVAWASRKLGRPVRWSQDRMENLQAGFHARDIVVEAELAADASGELLGLRARAVCDVGAYSAFPLTCALEPHTVATGLPGPYRLGYFAYEGYAVATNRYPQGAYRGVGFPLGPLATEGLMDRLAHRLAVDPVALRLKNLLHPNELPFASASGARYDSGDYPRLVQLALEQAGYADWQARRRQARGSRRRLGIGMACFVEPTGMNRAVYRKRGMVHVPGFDAAVLRVTPEGALEAALSTPSQGQSQYTAFRRLVADALEIAPELISVKLGDTAATPYGSGTFASRSVVAGGGALLRAARRLRARLEDLAAVHWGLEGHEVAYAAGAVRRADGAAALSLRELAEIAYTPFQELPPDREPGLSVAVAYDPPGVPFSAAVHVALVEVDICTGRVTPQHYVVAEDCGPMINAKAVDGQIRGGVAQGIGIALLEEMVYDASGQLLSSTLLDYLVPGSCDVPRIDIVHMETPSPVTEGGLKGVGESGTIGAPAAIANAVVDALGIECTELRLPLTPERVVALLAGEPR
ncbi:MAG: xanthine dehydrogenase family protein molybdopterin-binding subunit [Gammaproteobacteria bacterium]|nr:xanthine dehydrogenase family protein molybdopterin-binding subunit [Gammaproteobacteria bacterium]